MKDFIGGSIILALIFIVGYISIYFEFAMVRWIFS